MITEQDLLSAIAECQGERNPNANTCMKLAAYYTILNQMHGEAPAYAYAEGPAYDSGSEFSNVIRGKDTNSVMKVMDELMETVYALMPKLYTLTMKRLTDL